MIEKRKRLSLTQAFTKQEIKLIYALVRKTGMDLRLAIWFILQMAEGEKK